MHWRPAPESRKRPFTSIPRYLGQRVRSTQQAAIFQPPVVANVVGNETGKRQRKPGVPKPRRQPGDRRPGQRHGLPPAPLDGGSLPHRWVGVVQQTTVALDDGGIRGGRRQHSPQPRPLLGKEHRDAAAEQPVEFGVAAGRHPEQDQLGDAVRMAFGVGQGQRAAPRSAKHQPAVDLQVPAQRLHVIDELPGGVALQVGRRATGVRRASSTAALIEQHDAIRRRIEQSAMPRRAAGTGPAVHHQRRLATRIAARLPVDADAVANIQFPVLIRLDGGEKGLSLNSHPEDAR